MQLAEDILFLTQGDTDNPPMTQEEIAKATGVSQSEISQLSRLNRLIPALQQLLKTGPMAKRTGFIALNLTEENQERLVNNPTMKEAARLKDLQVSGDIDLSGIDIPNVGETGQEQQDMVISADLVEALTDGPVTLEYRGKTIRLELVEDE
ncbi:MAG: hypothetical protein GF334_08105 [Candidatus Altiarchaeales archaeon]|nr:hypothetical protein [Candidatus Altiarchaeales archaeon]